MIRLAIRRARRLFDAYPDIDDESLFADMLGEVSKAKYDPTKSQPHTFAYRVCWCRLRDVSRKRTRQAHVEQEAVDHGEFARGGKEDDGALEEIASGIIVSVKDQFERHGLVSRSKHCGKAYLDRIQRLSLYLLQQRMGWSCREAEAVLNANPQVLHALSVAQTPDHTFFSRVNFSVAQLRKILATPRPAAPAA